MSYWPTSNPHIDSGMTNWPVINPSKDPMVWHISPLEIHHGTIGWHNGPSATHSNTLGTCPINMAPLDCWHPKTWHIHQTYISGCPRCSVMAKHVIFPRRMRDKNQGPSWNPRWWMEICVLICHHCIAGILSHGIDIIIASLYVI
jgi:hypothetical protein